jgi:hypothetical protein
MNYSVVITCEVSFLLGGCLGYSSNELYVFLFYSHLQGHDIYFILGTFPALNIERYWIVFVYLELYLFLSAWNWFVDIMVQRGPTTSFLHVIVL